MSTARPQQVLGFMFSPSHNNVVLILKNKPSYLANQLNGVGGKVEPGETPLEAMVREFKEETGVETRAEDWTEYMTFRWKEHDVVCFYNVAQDEPTISSTTSEPVFICSTDPKCCDYPWRSNLQSLLAFAFDHDTGGREE